MSSVLTTKTNGPCWPSAWPDSGSGRAFLRRQHEPHVHELSRPEMMVGFEIVARKFTVPVPFCTELSRNVTAASDTLSVAA